MKILIRGQGLLGVIMCLLAACASTKATLKQEDCMAQAGFIYVAAGEFIAGSDRIERDYAYRLSAEALGDNPEAVNRAETQLRDRRWFEGERPQNRPEQPAFCITRNLITQAEYQEFVQATGHRAPYISEMEYKEQGFLVHPYSEVRPYLWRQEAPPLDKTNHPVVLVSYSDALAYARWRGQQDGAIYRLPTALEWEKAGRSEDGRYFPWGDDWRNDATNWGGSGLNSTSPVGAFPLSRSLYGVEDMAGNVFEYTSTLETSGETQRVVMKGCSWDDLPGFCRVAYRHTRPVYSRHILFGFRLVRVE